LKQGRLFADIEGNGFTKWIFQAGPFRVLVLGTRFSVEWDDPTGELEVEVASGRVAVEDVGQGNSEVLLETGKRLRASQRSGEMLIAPSRERIARESLAKDNRSSEERAVKRQDDAVTASKPAALTPAVDGFPLKDIGSLRPQGPLPQEDATPRPQQAEAVKKTKIEEERTPEWKQRLRVKDWDGTLAEAGPDALREIAAEASLDELWHLANTSRHQREAQTATRLFQAMRRRFKDASRSQTALFLMGKMSLTLSDDKVAARQWFGQYVREAPHGALREEALGHLMVISLALGDRPSAKRFAAQYLRQYKGGVFHDRATAILEP
jgi:TolA-binding protein